MSEESLIVVRQCSKCGGDIYRNGTSYCNPCFAEYAKARYEQDKEKAREKQRLWRLKNPEANKKSEWRANLKKMGVTPEWYEEKASAQGYLCEICGKDGVDGLRTRLSIDHDHSCCPKNKTCTNCRRGLICNKCNLMLGSAKDNPEVLECAADYLERWGK